MAARTRRAAASAIVLSAIAVGAIIVGALAAVDATADDHRTDDHRADDARILGSDPGWRIESVELLTMFLTQGGHGYQSQDGPDSGPGSERMWLIEPWAMITVRQSPRIVHQITIPVDAVTAASPDAVDAVSSASRRNIAGMIDIRSSFRRSEDRLTTRIAAHVEEPLSSGTLGAGWQRSLADDNAQIAIDGSLTVDGFDGRNQFGQFQGKSARETASANLSLSQLLSPTTTIDARYNLTVQHGTLAQTWNAVPVTDSLPDVERLPRDRIRHAIAVRLAHIIPTTRSTAKLWYRHYRDDFGVRAHSVEGTAYQYLTRWLYFRASYRFHRQTGADFFTTALPMALTDSTPRTADSDLAGFDAHEVSAGLTVVRGRAPEGWRAWSFAVEILHYQRSNQLHVNAMSLSLGRHL